MQFRNMYNSLVRLLLQHTIHQVHICSWTMWQHRAMSQLTLVTLLTVG